MSTVYKNNTVFYDNITSSEYYAVKQILKRH